MFCVQQKPRLKPQGMFTLFVLSTKCCGSLKLNKVDSFKMHIKIYKKFVWKADSTYDASLEELSLNLFVLKQHKY